MNRLSMLVACATVALSVSSIQALAAQCRTSNVQELQQLLVRHSPFRQEWTVRGHRGPVHFSVKRSSRSRSGYDLVIRASNEQGKLASESYSYPIEFRGERLNVKSRYSKWRLSLTSDCRLTGIQSKPGVGDIYIR